MKKTAPLSHRLNPELKRKLQDLALADRRSLTNYIEIVLEQHVSDQERPAQTVKRAEYAPF